MDSGLVGLHVKGVLSDRLLTNQEFTNIGRGRPFLGPQDDKASHTMKNKNGGLGLLCGARWTRGLAPALRPGCQLLPHGSPSGWVQGRPAGTWRTSCSAPARGGQDGEEERGWSIGFAGGTESIPVTLELESVRVRVGSYIFSTVCHRILEKAVQ